jgi:DNA polymerase III epsilon subunit family exonuclease
MDTRNSDDDIDLSNITWIAVDTETTGINPWEYEILEIGAVKFNFNSIIDRFQIIIKPEKKQDPKSRAIHKISENEILECGVSLSEALHKFYAFIGSAPLVFHNASFDLAFLALSSQRENLAFSNNFYYDTIYLLKTYKPELESYSLEYLKNYLNLDGPSHRALADAEITSHIFQWLISENRAKLSSKKKYKSFFRYHRKLNTFQVVLPRNLDGILSYFNKYIQTKSLLKISEINTTSSFDKSIKSVVPLDIMIFNQKLLLKCTVYPGNYTILIPLSSATIFDPDKGHISIANM